MFAHNKKMILSELEQIKYSFINNNNYLKFKDNIHKLMIFFDSLSELIFNCGHTITNISENRVYFLNTELIDSSVKTLNNIEYCCMTGSFSDANTLVRKFRDDLILFLYILDVVNNKHALSEEQISNIVGDSMDVEKFVKLIELTVNEVNNDSRKNDDEKSVDAWFQNKVSNLSKQQKRKLCFRNYMTHLKNTASINEVIKKYDLETNWENIRVKLNDYTHNNGRTYTRQNLMTVNAPSIEEYFDDITSRLDFVSAFFIVMLILVDPKLISSTDYIDHLECGLTPPDDSQYLIASFIQEFIDDYINKINPELKVFLKNNNKYGMLIN